MFDVLEKVLVAGFALLLLVVMWPGAKKRLEEARSAQERDWPGFLAPLTMVVILVIVLIMLARCGRPDSSTIDLPKSSAGRTEVSV
jgi:hypothetical protein